MFSRQPQTKPGHDSGVARLSATAVQSFLTAMVISMLFAGSSVLTAQGPPAPPPAAPVGLTCEGSGPLVADVAMNWTNTEVYDQIAVRRDAILLTIISGSATSYLDVDSPASFHVYSVHGMRVGAAGSVEGGGSTCTIQLFPPPLEPDLQPPGPLHQMPVILPGNLFEFVADLDAAILLGKALFWDMQAGSDGVQSCATCHYHAGADHRKTQQLNGGPNGTLEIAPLNSMVSAQDFPFHNLSNPENADSGVISSSNDVFGSEGILATDLVSIIEGSDQENTTPHPFPDFTVTNSDGSSAQVRTTTGRNAPTVINAIHYVEAFWDGRASFWFNGRDNWGARNPDATVLKVQPDGSVAETSILIDYAALASQAVGPIVSSGEMSAHGRNLFQVGKKMLSLDQPLAGQQVHASDSVLGPYRDNVDGRGLTLAYSDMISAAFVNDWHASDQLFDETGAPLIDGTTGLPRTGLPANIDEYTMKEANFSLFWGLAIMLYESTLRSDDSPFDRFRRAQLDATDPLGDIDAMTPEQRQGMVVMTQANCMFCHTTALFSSATSSKISTVLEQEFSAVEGLLERMPMQDFQLSIYDGGFYNLGVTLTADDIGRGGTDPFGHGLSMAAGFQEIHATSPIDPNYNNFLPFAAGTIVLDPSPQPWEDIATAGTFKTPTLRNTELTGPYFHNGSYSTLAQVIDFYARGGNFTEQNLTTLAPEMFPMPLFIGQLDRKSQMVAFLESLTDERVRWERAPFDHPELMIPIGAETEANGDLILDASGNAIDKFKVIPAVGAEGRMVETDAAGRPLEALTAFLMPTAVNDLQCTSVATTADLTWSTPATITALSSIRIFKDGVEIATTSGLQTAYTDVGVIPGERLYQVFGQDAHLGLGADCTAYIAPPAPTSMASLASGPMLTLSWANGWVYDGLDLYRDGVLLAENLAGPSTLYLDTNVSAGTHTYQLVGKLITSTPGVFIESETATLVAERSPLAPELLGCSTPGGTVAQIDWTNTEVYSDLVITRNGLDIATVTGDSTSYSDQTSPAGVATYSVRAVADGLPSSGVECSVQRAPLAVTNLLCDNSGGNGVLTWTNPEPWDEAHLLLDGSIIAVLSSNETEYTDFLLPSAGAGIHSYSLRTFVEGLNGELTSCSLIVAPSQVVLFNCSDTGQGVLLTWTNMSSYDTLAITREGAPLVTLPGQTSSYMDLTTPSGQVAYTIVATVAGSESGPDTCSLEMAPAGVIGLTCSTIASGVSLDWTNAEFYDELDIRRGGVLMATVPGTLTSFTDTAALGGASQYTVTPRFESVDGPSSEICLGYYQPNPVIALQVQVNDPCTGSSNISWLNTSLYDWIRVELNGVPAMTLPGIMSSLNLTLAVGTVHSIAVISITDDMESTPVLVTAEIPADDALAPSDVTASVEPDNCEASVSWVSNGSYSEVQILVDGVQVATATPQDSTIVVPLPGSGSFTIQVDATSACGLSLSGSQATATCAPRFMRGDHNGDGALDISDPLGVLGYIFSNAPVNCLDASDANDDGGVDVSDAVRLLLHLFGGSGPLPAPHGFCASDPTADALDCSLEQGCP